MLTLAAGWTLTREPGPAHSGPAEARAPGDDAAEVAKEHLRKNAARLGLRGDLADLEVDGVTQSATGEHVRFRQTLAGLPVWGGEVSVRVDRQRKGEPSVNSGYRKGRAPARTAAAGISQDEAIAAARQAVGSSPKSPAPLKDGVQQVYFPASPGDPSSPLRLAWSVKLRGEQGQGNWEVLVDAGGGGVVGKFDYQRRDSWGVE